MSLSIRSALAVLVAVAACGSPATVATPAPAPAPVTTTSTATPAATSQPTRVPAVHVADLPRNWQQLDEATDGIPGISSERAMHELLAGRAPKRTVLVAIIDNGIDTAHVDLRPNLWTDPQNQTHGWDFIGGRDGRDINFDTFEVTRQYARCHNMAAASGAPPITDTAQCAQIDADYQKQKTEITNNVTGYRQVNDVMQQILPLLAQGAGVSADSLTATRVRAINPGLSPQVSRAREIYLELASEGATPQQITEGLKSLEGQLKYSLDPNFNPRTIVGDNYTDVNQRDYGNRDVMGPNAGHGSHVAGIIGAVRNNGVGVDGIAPAVKFMMIRAVPDGDERDKDIANAIRYATDHGAQIISMSFGKAYSPYKSAVDDAVKYADAHGVLMVHAAGNDGQDLSVGHNYPTPIYLDGGRPQNWIEVGASSWKGGDSLAANFSNYSQQLVDVFAPGVDILSTVPGNHYERDSGTSMAAPVVSGLAALLMAYYPNLSANDVKHIILASTMKLGDQRVQRPGGGGLVPFNALSVTGGIVNAYNAVRMAEEMTNRVRP
jgi:subtilisin family serine protease